MKQIVLLCGVPYCGKTTFLKKTGAPCLIMDDFLQKRYKTHNEKTVAMRLSQEGHQAVFADVAAKAVEMAKTTTTKAPFFIEGMFTFRHERRDMINALKQAGAETIDCIFLSGVPFTELLSRCCESKSEFKCPMDALVDRCERFEAPVESEGFNEVIIMQPCKDAE